MIMMSHTDTDGVRKVIGQRSRSQAALFRPRHTDRPLAGEDHLVGLLHVASDCYRLIGSKPISAFMWHTHADAAKMH